VFLAVFEICDDDNDDNDEKDDKGAVGTLTGSTTWVLFAIEEPNSGDASVGSNDEWPNDDVIFDDTTTTSDVSTPLVVDVKIDDDDDDDDGTDGSRCGECKEVTDATVVGDGSNGTSVAGTNTGDTVTGVQGRTDAALIGDIVDGLIGMAIDVVIGNECRTDDDNIETLLQLLVLLLVIMATESNDGDDVVDPAADVVRTGDGCDNGFRFGDGGDVDDIPVNDDGVAFGEPKLASDNNGLDGDIFVDVGADWAPRPSGVRTGELMLLLLLTGLSTPFAAAAGCAEMN
jgi:hypothetical protein